MPAWKVICIALSGVFAFVIMISAFGSWDEKVQSVSSGSDVATGNSRVTVLDYEWSRAEYGTKYIVGTVRNNTDSRLDYVQVDFNL